MASDKKMSKTFPPTSHRVSFIVFVVFFCCSCFFFRFIEFSSLQIPQTEAQNMNSNQSYQLEYVNNGIEGQMINTHTHIVHATIQNRFDKKN